MTGLWDLLPLPCLLACFFMGGAHDRLPGQDMVIIFRMRLVTSGTADGHCTALPCPPTHPPGEKAPFACLFSLPCLSRPGP